MFMLLVDVLNRSAMNQGRARLYATLSRVLSGLATACTVPVIIAGLIYGLMVWRLIYPPQVLDIYLAIDESIARTRTTIAPGRIQSVNKPCGGTTWRTPGGSYLKDATVYLRAPSQRATLVAVLTSTPDLKPGTEMTVTVDGQTVLRQQLSNGQQVIATPPLQNLGGGQIVPIKFELSGADASPPHTPLPIVVSGLTLTTEDSAKAAQTIADWRGACGV